MSQLKKNAAEMNALLATLTSILSLRERRTRQCQVRANSPVGDPLR